MLQIKTTLKAELKSYTTLHWWNMGKKTLAFKGELKDFLKENNITFTKTKSEHEGLYIFRFKNNHGVKYVKRGTLNDFTHIAKQFIQMELVRMGDKAQLYVDSNWRPTVTVNH